MLLTESIEKSKNFFQKTLLNLKSILFGGYEKLSKPALLNPFSCSICKTEDHQIDQYYTDFCNEWESDMDEAKKRKNSSIVASEEPGHEEDECSGNFLNFPLQNSLKNKQEGRKEEKKKSGSHVDKREDQCYHKMNAESYALAQKMKQLDMMDAGDVEHVLDVEEALHYYSRLKSPVYLDIVDKFFMDMYSEFSVPQAPAGINSSRRRLGSIRL